MAFITARIRHIKQTILSGDFIHGQVVMELEELENLIAQELSKQQSLGEE